MERQRPRNGNRHGQMTKCKSNQHEMQIPTRRNANEMETSRNGNANTTKWKYKDYKMETQRPQN
jgi:hypothetical protein